MIYEDKKNAAVQLLQSEDVPLGVEGIMPTPGRTCRHIIISYSYFTEMTVFETKHLYARVHVITRSLAWTEVF